ncbi:recombination mediator RecR [Neofamilia massiliensis]|uniref:recombination mediator RecR n=1 Tax=Neofamilia massiliensis TaxID=1673724 RepID=UPI0006BB928F|nr:recombination mediator RecR [Neofamilia massiliensis]
MENPIGNLINQLSRLPGIGEKTAQRLAYYIIELDEARVKDLTDSITRAKENSGFCSICNNITDKDPCEICSNDSRNKKLICVVEQPKDVMAIERGKKYKGLYHVLHGDIISSVDGDEKIKKLIERIRDNEVEEIILTFTPNASGQASIIYLSELLKPLGIKVTKIAYGLPYGSDMDFFDKDTINIAIANRTEI